MVIRELNRITNKNREYQEDISKTFYSFNEVFNYCLNKLTNITPRFDDVVFTFKILDTNEIFRLHGSARGKDSVIDCSFCFDNLIKIQEIHNEN